jgi:uncharacterized protein
MRYSRIIALSLFFGLWLAVAPIRARAVYDALSVPNNRYGVHILDPDEVADAAKLVNSSGGDWGYVTIPIRSDDRDKEKWTRFFLNTRKYHVTPIVRLVTYINGDTWVAPTSFDLVDFANFLSDMPWPTQNRYIILFNEPNHAQEWGGRIAPVEYATLLLDARQIFSTRSENFFLLSAGMDMSSPNSPTSMDALNYYREMSRSQPGWYSSIDGLSVHAYPNPGFLASPYSRTRYGIVSYEYEVNVLRSFGFSEKPVFITETGYIGTGDFYTPAFVNIWTDSHIVAITPFVLFAGAGDFVPFSLLNSSHQPSASYKAISQLPKVAGSPLLDQSFPSENLSDLSFSDSTPSSAPPTNIFSRLSRALFPLQPKLLIRDIIIGVEIADTDRTRERGLSGRNSLPENSGMLFRFPQPGKQIFWMKEMKFPLDFVWIRDGRIIQLDTQIPPPSQTGGIPKIISPASDIDSVLEVNSGFIEKHNLKLGDPVVFNPDQ